VGRRPRPPAAGPAGGRAARSSVAGLNYVFADCRWALDDPDWGRAQYLAAHIPGAIFLDVERDLAAPPGPGGRHPLPEPGRFVAAAGNAGIGRGVLVVADGSLGGAERLWWLLRHHGHDGCAVIDLDAWRGPLAAGEERNRPVRFEPDPRSGDTIELDELAARHRELVVVDARLAGRWRGEPNPVDRVPGRIPGALNAPWPSPLPDLPDGELVAYCGSGVTACVPLHRLALAGREGRLYPGSWSEWEQHPGLPVERDA
jgi:thiosulfate/3-mercaptopyruvate sulfurtransferase